MAPISKQYIFLLKIKFKVRKINIFENGASKN